MIALAILSHQLEATTPPQVIARPAQPGEFRRFSPHEGPPRLVIVPGDAADPLVPGWTPTRIQVDGAVSALRTYLGPNWPGWHGTRQSMSRPWIEDYSLQAQGATVPAGGRWDVVGPAGTKLIVLHGFCSQWGLIDDPLFDKQVIVVWDGGSCFFQAYYDVSAGKIVYFRANGVA